MKCGDEITKELLHLTRRSDGHFFSSASTLSSNRFYLMHDIHTFFHLPKDDVLAVQPRGDNGRDKELTT